MDHQSSTMPVEAQNPAHAFYRDALALLDGAAVPYVVGGGYAMTFHTGIPRQTKDLDIFVRPDDKDRALDTLAAAGYRTEITWPHFLCKALNGPAFVDILYNSGNGLSPVDDEWFTNAISGEMLGRSVLVCPAEEILWTKAFVQDRDRFDGGDVAHLLLARGDKFDWPRLLRRFGSHQRVLLAHLVLYGYIYPSQRWRVPAWVMEELITGMADEPVVYEPICQGTFLAQKQFLHDVRVWEYIDARLKPEGPLTPYEISTLTAA